MKFIDLEKAWIWYFGKLYDLLKEKDSLQEYQDNQKFIFNEAMTNVITI